MLFSCMIGDQWLGGREAAPPLRLLLVYPPLPELLMGRLGVGVTKLSPTGGTDGTIKIWLVVDDKRIKGIISTDGTNCYGRMHCALK